MSGRGAIVALAAVCLLCFFWNLGSNGLFDLDEALYAECAREMDLTGDYVVPRVNNQPFFEKPPLVYWAGAAFYRLLGRSEFSTRLPSALATVVLVGLVLAVGRRKFGWNAGVLAAFYFALSPMVFGAARQLTTDATLDLCIAGSLLAWFHAYSSDDPRAKRWNYVFWAGMALGVLAKGLPGVLIPAATIGVFKVDRWWLRRKSADTETAPTETFSIKSIALGLLIFLAIALPWHLLAYRAAGEAFTSEYIVRQHLARFRGGDTSHLAPFWFFVPGFLVGAFPWSFFLPAAFLSRCEGEKDYEGAAFRRFLKIWAALVFLMFSASGSKLISYILPMYPPAALLVGDWCARALHRPEAKRSLLLCGGFALALSLLLFGIVQFSEPIVRMVEQSTHRPIGLDQIPPGALRWAAHLFLCAALSAGAFVVMAAMNRRRAAFVGMMAGMAAFFAFAVFEGLPLIDRALLRPLHESAAAAGKIAVRDHGSVIVKASGTRRPSVLFYLPDSKIGMHVDPGGVLEVKTPEEVIGYLEAPEMRPLPALVDAASADQIKARTDAQEVFKRPGWVVLEAR